MSRDLAEWDPRYDDYMGRGHVGPPHLPSSQPSTRSTGQSYAAGRRPRGLYVKNVPSAMKAESLRRLFSEFGRVESVVMGRAGPDASKPRWAIVNPQSTRDAVSMVSALHGRPPLCLSVTPAISPEEKRRQKREKEEGQRFLEEVRREALAARSKGTTPALKTDRNNITTTTTKSSPVCRSSTTTTSMTTTTSTSTTSSVSGNNTSTTTTTTTQPDSSTLHKIIQKPFEVSCGMVLVAYRQPEPCLWCGVTGQLVCSVCGTWYCGKVCQEAHWPLHQDSCTPASVSPPTGQHDSRVSSAPKIPECFKMD